jgi:GcrA cell cycle regulator
VNRTALLVEHYNVGLSAAESAGLIGGVSKNAVISKRRRLGLVATVVVGWRASASDEGGEPRRRACRPRRFRGPPPLPVEPLPDMEAAVAPDMNPKRLTERRWSDCAWPLGPAEAAGDYRTLSCGAPRARGRYCAAHAALAYRSAP